MTGYRGAGRQGGFILWLLLVALVMAGSYAGYRAANGQLGRFRQDAVLAATLLRAKDALLARAVVDDNRPGSLPCPDLITNSPGSYNLSGDGKADLLAGDQCPSNVGGFPWRTLGLPPLTDEGGNPLWYALSPTLRDDTSAQPINSDTAMALSVDNRVDIAAIIMAPGSPTGGQHRPSVHPADYLEGGNGQSNNYVSRAPDSNFNDVLLVLTRQEVMAAVEKRVAGEIRQCLEEHVLSSANPEHRYPWPTPLAAANFLGHPGSRFGRMPQAQPTSGPAAAANASLARLAQGAAQLAGSPDGSQQLAAARSLDDAVIRARNLFETFFLAASQLKQQADEMAARLQTLQTTIATAAGSGRISRSEGSAIRTLSGDSAATLGGLPELLGQFGVDPFPWELARRRAVLQNAATAAQLLGASRNVMELLTATYSPRPDLAPALSASLAAGTEATAQAAAAESGDANRLALARSASGTLLEATGALLAAVDASRVNVLSGEIDDYARLLDELYRAWQISPRPEDVAALGTAARAGGTILSTISTGVSAIVSARNAAVPALAMLGAAAQAPLPNSAQLAAQAGLAVDSLRTLEAAIATNEAIDNNLARTSIDADRAAYAAARTEFVQIDTAAIRPLQSTIVPYADALGNAAGSLKLWAGIVAANAGLIAPLAKASPLENGSSPVTVEALDGSAYSAAENVRNSLSGRTGLSEALQAEIDSPGHDNQARVAAALAETAARLSILLERAGTLAGELPGTTASAQPMVWNSARCDMLRPAVDSWWNRNQWTKLIFYQIAGPLQATARRITVNGLAGYRLVVVASGRALAGQNRNVPGVANFLEGVNADPSRDGEARNPQDALVAGPATTGFNDCLAY
ncbi:MAG: hypothetical protein ACM3X0_05335 [Bacteroidota bacterium]